MKPKTFTELLLVPLTGEDLAKLADQADQFTARLQELEAEKRVLPKRIDSVKEELFEISEKRRSKQKRANVNCEERPDFDGGKVDIVRLDTGEIIRSRVMTDEDRQDRLFENPAGHDGSEPLHSTCSECGLINAHNADCSSNDEPEVKAPDHSDIGGTPTNTIRTRAELEEWAKARAFSLGTQKIKRVYIDGNPYVIVGVHDDENGFQIAACAVLPIQNCESLKTATSEERIDDCIEKKIDFFHIGIKVNCGTEKKPEWWVIVGEELIFTEAPFESTVETPQPFEPIAAPAEPNPLTHKLDYQVNYALHSRTGAANRWAILRHMPENGGQDSVFLKACAMELSGHTWLSIAGDDCTWAISKKDGRIKFYTGTAQAKGTPALDADAFLETARRVLGIERKEVEGD
jgi:hypothetical protein